MSDSRQARDSETEREIALLAGAILDAMRSNDPKAFILGDVEDIAIDGHFNLKSVAQDVLESLRVKSRK